MAGLYPAPVIVERNSSSSAAATLFPPFVAPDDLEVFGIVLNLGTAPGAGDGVAVNVSNSPTAQLSASQGGTAVSAFNLWTTANRPTILGANTTSPGVPATFTSLAINKPYAVNYPLPGPSGTVGYITAQATTQTTETPVVTPPTTYKYGISGLVAPDNTYTDYNGVTGSPATIVHAGDVLTFVISAAGASVSVGAAANLEIVLYAQVR